MTENPQINLILIKVPFLRGLAYAQHLWHHANKSISLSKDATFKASHQGECEIKCKYKMKYGVWKRLIVDSIVTVIIQLHEMLKKRATSGFAYKSITQIHRERNAIQVICIEMIICTSNLLTLLVAVDKCEGNTLNMATDERPPPRALYINSRHCSMEFFKQQKKVQFSIYLKEVRVNLKKNNKSNKKSEFDSKLRQF